MRSGPLVIAHRGSHDRVDGPVENTPEAFERARALGADMVELDVRRLADGELVVFHDHAVRGRDLRQLTLPELAEAAGYRPPRFADALRWAEDVGMGLDVELKEDGYIVRAADLLMGFQGELLVTSFDDRVLRHLHAFAPELRTGLLVTFTALGASARAKLCSADAVVIQEKLMSPSVAASALGHFLQLYVWDVLPDRGADWVRHDHVSGVITDDVPGLLAARDGAAPAAA